MLGLYHKLLQGLIRRHRQDGADAARIAVLDARSRRGTLSPRNVREWAALLEKQGRYHGSISRQICIGITHLTLWEITWLFANPSHKDVWRDITSRF